MVKQISRGAGALSVALALAPAIGCHRDTGKPPPPTRSKAFPVQVAPVASHDVNYELTAVGSVEAFEKVAVSARVSGVIERVLFTEGDTVQKGQVLAEIDMDRYVLAARGAKAALERAEAARAEAEAGLARRKDVTDGAPGLIAGEEIEQWRAKVATLTADVQEKRVLLDQANLNLSQARVRAPVAGVVQTRDVHTGQYAQAGTLLATLLQRDPLLLRFRIPESDASHVNPNMLIRFTVRHMGESGTARIIHVAGAAGEASRMVEVAAKVLPQKNAHYRPGAFAEVTIPVDSHSGAAVIPASAVRPSEKGFLGYVIQDSHAKERRLTLGMRTADGKVEVKDGVSPGEPLVVRGAEALQDGVEVRIDTAASAALGDGDDADVKEETAP